MFGKSLCACLTLSYVCNRRNFDYIQYEIKYFMFNVHINELIVLKLDMFVNLLLYLFWFYFTKNIVLQHCFSMHFPTHMRQQR